MRRRFADCPAALAPPDTRLFEWGSGDTDVIGLKAEIQKTKNVNQIEMNFGKGFIPRFCRLHVVGIVKWFNYLASRLN
jgi:hypothetical protein